MNKSIIFIGIISAGVIGGVAIFASMPTTTWQDNRTNDFGIVKYFENWFLI